MPGDESTDAQYERLKRQLQQTILTDYPNPERKGCPGEAVLQELATRYADEAVDNDPNWHHVTHCSPCYREYLDIRAAMKRKRAKSKALPMALGLAAATASVVGVAVYLSQRPSAPRDERPQIAELVYRPRVVDLEGRSITRSEGARDDTTPIVLGRAPEELTIRLPFGSRPGQYEVQLLKAVDAPLVSASGEARLENGTTTLTARVDLRTLSPGRYLLGVRRLPADWTYYPAELR